MSSYMEVGAQKIFAQIFLCSVTESKIRYARTILDILQIIESPTIKVDKTDISCL